MIFDCFFEAAQVLLVCCWRSVEEYSGDSLVFRSGSSLVVSRRSRVVLNSHIHPEFRVGDYSFRSGGEHGTF